MDIIESMDIFKGIDFNDSFVLGWSSNETEITFKIEASIWPESPFYIKPKSNEYTCYRKCEIQFTEFSSYSGLAEQSNIKPVKDLDGTLDYGNIDSLLKTNQGFKVIGEFGNLEIMNGKVQFKFYT
jgi:hypothetical protein